MIDNKDLFNACCKNQESYLDPYYTKDTKAIISESRTQPNPLMNANSEILENISAYKIALQAQNIEMQNTILNTIIRILENPQINVSEFVSYWCLHDMSYSIYKKISEHDTKKQFLQSIIPDFIQHRHELYKTHGYSVSTLQAIQDSKSHKKNGNSGNKKITKILEQHGLSHCNGKNISEFKEKDKIFIYPDKGDNILFQNILSEYNISFYWGKNHEGKHPDILFKIQNHIFILEHKHMKEKGGGQDKQILEIIDFISHEEKGVHYISFLDGIYFNILSTNHTTNTDKVFLQKQSIRESLTKNKQNYFVNTYGFKRLLQHLTSPQNTL